MGTPSITGVYRGRPFMDKATLIDMNLTKDGVPQKQICGFPIDNGYEKLDG